VKSGRERTSGRTPARGTIDGFSMDSMEGSEGFRERIHPTNSKKSHSDVGSWHRTGGPDGECRRFHLRLVSKGKDSSTRHVASLHDTKKKEQANDDVGRKGKNKVAASPITVVKQKKTSQKEKSWSGQL